MPSSSLVTPKPSLAERLGPPLDGALRGLTVASHVALAVLICTGEAVRWVDYRDTLISAPLLRAVHVLAGFVLLSALSLRTGDALLRGLRRLRAGRPAVATPPRLTLRGALDVAAWSVVALLVLSGVERYVQFRYGVSLLPILPPAAWWALHRPLLGYLYAILLINLAIRAKVGLRRAFYYLTMP